MGIEEAGQKIIWESPDSVFYYSQEMAIGITREGAKPYIPKGVEIAS